jgi:hypothetical protein
MVLARAAAAARSDLFMWLSGVVGARGGDGR